jgi:diguanylate cyclase (GGDEF)-like protein
MFAAGLLAQSLLTDASAIAAVALLGYLFCRRQRRAQAARPDDQLSDEIARAARIADQVAQVTTDLGREAGAHARNVADFQARLADMRSGVIAAEWRKLRDEADRLLGPTLKLATNLTLACHQLRLQQSQLITFSASRVDGATGLHNRRSLEEQLDAFFSIHAAGKRRFALAMFSVCPAGADELETSEDRLRQVARLLETCIREDDFVARYSYDEFVVLMPQTAAAGALAFGERLLVRAVAELNCPMWGGVVEANKGESSDKLLSRADSALYSARAVGAASLFLHTGQGVRRHALDLEQAVASGQPREELASFA